MTIKDSAAHHCLFLYLENMFIVQAITSKSTLVDQR